MLILKGQQENRFLSPSSRRCSLTTDKGRKRQLFQTNFEGTVTRVLPKLHTKMNVIRNEISSP